MVMTQALQAAPLSAWSGPPMMLIRPRVSEFGWFRFEASDEMIQRGYDAAKESLAYLEQVIGARSGIFPRRQVQLAVDQSRCNGCGLCVAQAPETMALDLQGKAFPRSEVLDWSPADGGFVRHCPTGALSASPVKEELDKAS
jgi:NTE family protein